MEHAASEGQKSEPEDEEGVRESSPLKEDLTECEAEAQSSKPQTGIDNLTGNIRFWEVLYGAVFPPAFFALTFQSPLAHTYYGYSLYLMLNLHVFAIAGWFGKRLTLITIGSSKGLLRMKFACYTFLATAIMALLMVGAGEALDTFMTQRQMATEDTTQKRIKWCLDSIVSYAHKFTQER